MKKTFIISLIFLSLSGCMAVAPAIVGGIVNGAILYKDGQAIKYYENHQTTVYNATKRACQELKLPILKDSKTKNGFSIVAGTTDKFKINIEKNQENITKVGIRVGLGNTHLAELFYSKLDSEIDTIYFRNQTPDGE